MKTPYIRTPCWLLLASTVLASCADKPVVVESNEPTISTNEIRFAKNAPALDRLLVEAAQTAKPIILKLPARITWDEDHTSRVTPPVAGRVSVINANLGAAVKPGQALALLTSSELGAAQAEGARAQADYSQAQRSAARSKELAAAGIIAGKDLEQAQNELARAGAESARTKMRLQSLGATSAVDQRYALRSPIAGVVVERNVNMGTEWRPDQPSAPMFVVSDPNYLWCWIDAPETALGLFKVGESVKLQASAWPGEVYEAKVQTVGDALDPVSRTLKVKAALRNVERHLKNEMFVSAEIPFTPSASVQVPAKAVFLSDGTRQVFVKTAMGQFTLRTVTGVDYGDDRLFIQSGLKVGEEVVVDGALYLQQLLRNAKSPVAASAQPAK